MIMDGEDMNTGTDDASTDEGADTGTTAPMEGDEDKEAGAM